MEREGKGDFQLFNSHLLANYILCIYTNFGKYSSCDINLVKVPPYVSSSSVNCASKLACKAQYPLISMVAIR